MASVRRGRHNKLFTTEDLPGSKPITKERSLMHVSNKKIFIGVNFQAVLPSMLSITARTNYDRWPSPEVLLWEPSERISDDKINALLAEMKPKGFHEDQILALLQHQDYDIDSTLEVLTNVFAGKHETMRSHDKEIFRKEYKDHGKNFDRIHDLLPHQSLQTLINYYYTEFKRTKHDKFLACRPETELRKLTANVAGVTMNGANGASGLPTAEVKRALGRPRLIRDPLADSHDFEHDSSDPVASFRRYRGPKVMTDMDVEDGIRLPSEVGSAAAPRNVDLMIAAEKEQLHELHGGETLVFSALGTAKGSFTVTGSHVMQEALIEDARGEIQKDPTPVWQQNEIMIFMRALVEFGTDFGKTSRLLTNKTEQQVRNMYYNRAHFYGLEKLIRIHEEKSAATVVGLN